MTRIVRSISAVVLMLMLWHASMDTLRAQSAAQPEEQETLDLYVGDIFELLPVHTLDNPTYTWILTQDRNFVEAGRTKVFRKRLIMPGVYTLYAEISSGDGSKHITRTFTLNYQPRVPGQVPATSGSGTAAGTLVRTKPALDAQGRAILPATTQLLQLEPIDPTQRPIAADLDSTKDNDGDGNTGNDIDTDLTFFQSDATPLYVWIAEPLTMRSITVTAVRPEGAIVQHIGVASEAYAREQGFIQSPIELNVVRTVGRSYSFQATFGALSQPQTPLLYNWEFGDGQQSLLSSPTHEYAADGTYEVRVRVRNLTDGSVIAEHTQMVEVISGNEPPATDDQPMPPEEKTDTNGTSLGYIALLAGVFILSVVIGVGIIILLSRLRSRGTSLSDTIEAMEQSIIKKEGGAVKDATPTLSIAPPPSKAPAVPEPAQREEDRATSNPLQQKPLKVEEKNAPAWLKSGLSNQPTAQATPATPPAPAAQKPQSVPPPWLQQAPAAPRPAQQSAPAAPAPQPQAPKAPPSPVPQPPKPAPTTQPAPAAQKPQSVPPWLQQAPAAPRPAQQSAPAAPAPQPQAPKMPQPPVPQPLKSVPATQPTQQPLTPAPTTPPAPVAPRPPAPPAPAPEQAQARATPTPPPAAQQPATPAATPPAMEDAPIAIIRADSLNEGSGDQPPAAPPPVSAA